MKHNLLTVLKNLENTKANNFLNNKDSEIVSTYETFITNEINFWNSYELPTEVKEYVVLNSANYEMTKFMDIYKSSEKASERGEGHFGTSVSDEIKSYKSSHLEDKIY